MDMSTKKQRFANKAVEVASEAAALYERIGALMAELFAEEFNSSGSNEFIDGDFVAPVEYLDAAKFASLTVALQALQTTFDVGGNITAIRKAKYE